MSSTNSCGASWCEFAGLACWRIRLFVSHVLPCARGQFSIAHTPFKTPSTGDTVQPDRRNGKEWGDGIHLWAADHTCISQCLPHAARFTSKEASQLHASSDTAQPAFSSVLTFPHFLVMLDISHCFVRRQPPANAISLHRSLFHTIAVLLFLSVPSEMSIVTNRESTQLAARHTTSCSRCDGVPDVASKDSF